MDPLTALGLAGNIVQFVDFGSKLLSSGVQLYKSTTGSLKVDDELELVAAEIKALTSKLTLEQDLGVNFQIICREAADIASEVLTRLDKLKVRGKNRVWKSLWQAVNIAWTAEELANLVGRLERLKRSLESSLLVSLRENVGTLSAEVSTRFTNLDEQTQRIILALLNQRDSANEEISHDLRDQTLALSQILSRLQFSNLDEHRKTREELRKVTGITRNAAIVDVSAEEEHNVRFIVQTRILESLKFESMTERQGRVAKAHEKTFEWIFSKQVDDSWSNFAEWLSSRSGVYWIKGKAGSGKSTLMRYISANSLTEKYLNHWAGDLPLFTGHHFFWNSGLPAQKSQEGLLRALLYGILSKQPILLPTVFPSIWARTYTVAATLQQVPITYDWSLSGLMEAFMLLVNQNTLPVKLCLFIDGLDEFDGDHGEISRLFKDVSTSSNIKVCLSSRPWNVFEAAFKNCPKLKLQDLTCNDIKHYVIDRLNKNAAFECLAEKEPEAAPALVSEITEKADGVFLWVEIVVKSLLRGIIENDDDVAVLQRRLRLLPSDLENLYDYMFSLIERIYEEKSAQIFQIVRAARIYSNHLHDEKLPNKKIPSKPLTTIALHFAVSPERGLDVIKALSTSDLAARKKTMDVHLNVHCAGLLETWKGNSTADNSTVHYLHRTAREFVEGEDKSSNENQISGNGDKSKTWGLILRRTSGTAFNPNTAMVKSCVYQMSASTDDYDKCHSFAVDALIFAYHSDKQKDSLYVHFIKQLDQIMLEKGSIREHKRHWANDFLSSPNETDSLLPLAIQCDLPIYVGEHLEMMGGVKRPKLKRPYFEYVVFRESITHRLPFSPGVASLLLGLGADPNYKYDNYSVWEKALYALEVHFESDPPAIRSLDQAELLTFLDTFVQHGASPKAYIIVGNYDKKALSALGVVKSKIGRSPERKATELIQNMRRLGFKEQVRRRQLPITVFQKEMHLFWLDP